MMRPAVLCAAGVGLAVVTLLAGQKPPSRPRAEFVELDAVVDDDSGRPVPGLRREDFQIKEDGRRVAVTSFSEVSAAGIDGEADSRSVVLMLDDTSMSPSATQVVQGIARMFASRVRPADHLAVVRLTHHDDEPIGDGKEALERIAEYRSGSYPFLGDTIESWLKTLAKLAQELQRMGYQRTVIVCIGTPFVLDPYLPEPQESLLWPYWLKALVATADAGLAVYVVDPSGVTGSFDLGDGLVDETGGAVFSKSNNFERAVDSIWRDAGHYYRLGYVPTARARELHSIEVTVTHRDFHVRARHSRGD